MYRLRENFQAEIRIESNQAVISCAGGDLKFEAEFAETLETILQGKSFDLGIFKGLHADKTQDLIKKLIAFGVITLIGKC